MTVAATAKRRRRQATMNNAHLSGMGVSRYHKPDARKLAARLARVIATERRIQQKAQTKK